MNKIKFLLILLLLIHIHTTYATVNVNSCQTIDEGTLDIDRLVLITQNIAYGGASACFFINTDNFTIDCQNYNITGSETGYGFNDRDNIIVQNCNFKDFSSGASLQFARNFTIINSSFVSCSNTGLYLNSLYNSTFRNITIIETNNKGIDLRQNSHGNVFEQMLITNNGNGIDTYIGSYDNIIQNSQMYNNTGYNLKFNSETNSVLNNYLGNSSKILSDDWSNAQTIFSGNTYSIYYGCFDSPTDNVCEFVASSTSSAKIVPFINLKLFLSVLILIISYIALS